MREPYIEGIANHDDPESCAAARKGGREALTGARAGWVLSREIRNSRMLTSLSFDFAHASRFSECATLPLAMPDHECNFALSGWSRVHPPLSPIQWWWPPKQLFTVSVQVAHEHGRAMNPQRKSAC